LSVTHKLSAKFSNLTQTKQCFEKSKILESRDSQLAFSADEPLGLQIFSLSLSKDFSI